MARLPAWLERFYLVGTLAYLVLIRAVERSPRPTPTTPGPPDCLPD